MGRKCQSCRCSNKYRHPVVKLENFGDRTQSQSMKVGWVVTVVGEVVVAVGAVICKFGLFKRWRAQSWKDHDMGGNSRTGGRERAGVNEEFVVRKKAVIYTRDDNRTRFRRPWTLPRTHGYSFSFLSFKSAVGLAAGLAVDRDDVVDKNIYFFSWGCRRFWVELKSVCRRRAHCEWIKWQQRRKCIAGCRHCCRRWVEGVVADRGT